MTELSRSNEYRDWVATIKSRVHSSQIKAAIQVNRQLIELYWYLGEQIVEREASHQWGDGFMKTLSRDLLGEFPDMRGFSVRNLQRIRRWRQFWDAAISGDGADNQSRSNTALSNAPQLVAQIPWGHNGLILEKVETPTVALFYVQKTIENNWSRSVLTHQIEGGLHLREGKAIDNFEATLPEPDSDLAKQVLRDPYNFDFLDLTQRHNERELESGLMDHLTKFLLELGAGFAFLGRQYRIVVDGDDYTIDLLFYHVHLHCYVVVELKIDQFKPEYAGKLNFYISAVDSQLRVEADAPTIGILICKSKNNTVVEYSLRDLAKPIGVSEYELNSRIPDRLRSSLPTVEDIEAGIVSATNPVENR